MWMLPIAAISVVPRRRWRVAAGGTDIAAAVLNATSCSVTRTRVGLCCVEPTADGADPTSGVAVDAGSKCDILRMPPDGWWLLTGVTASELIEGCGPQTAAAILRLPRRPHP